VPVHEFGLTGGIGSGKSTVAAGLVARGAELIDADQVVRDLQEPGGAVFEAMVEHFGADIVASDGTLDRQAVADRVFADPEALAALNAIVHPAVGAEMKARRAALADAEAIVVLDIPLLVRPDGSLGQKEWADLAGIVVVDCDPEVAVARLVEHRGFEPADAEARIAAQATRAQRAAVADLVIDNSGDLAALEPQLDHCWEWMNDRADPDGTVTAPE
jgi:dephospho-CoA kinase